MGMRSFKQRTTIPMTRPSNAREPSGLQPALPRFPPFHPHAAFRSGDLQTLAGVILPHQYSGRNALRRPGKKFSVKLSDGDAIVLHEESPNQWEPAQPVCLLIHGMTGCHRSRYMERMSARLCQRGYRCFRMDQRNSGAARDLAARPYHAGRSEDVLAAILEIEHRCPGSPLSVCGFSLAGNMVLKMLGENPGQVPDLVVRAAAINPPIDLSGSVECISTRRNRFYDRYFARRLFAHLRTSSRMTENPAFDRLSRPPRSVREFDEVFTAPASGFRSGL